MSGVPMSIMLPAGQPGIGLCTVIASWGLVLYNFCVQVGRGFAMLALRVQMNLAAAIALRRLFSPC